VSRFATLGVLGAAVVAALTVTATAGGANECDGLQVCVPVAGPWVVVPAAGGPSRPETRWQLTCPEGHVVGGTDARLSRRALDVTFLGLLGSPVNPGITTRRSITFVGTWVGATAQSSSFKPFIGCMPASGGGPRIPTAAGAFRPGEPTTLRTRNVRVRPGAATVRAGCRADERLVGAGHAFGFHTRTPPSDSLAGGVTGTRSVQGRQVVVRVSGDAELEGVRAVVQVQALCARVS
jgi:hypothetical protein